MSSPGWGAPPTARWRVRGGVGSDLAAGSLLLATWVLLWAFFVIAVMRPAATLHQGPRKAAAAAEIEVVTTPCSTSPG